MKFLKAIDFLGSGPQTYIFKMTRHKTKFGGLISLTSVLIGLTFSLYFSIVLFARQQLDLLSSQTTDFSKSINLDKIPLLFMLSKSNGEVYNSTVVYPVFQLWNYYAENKGLVNITTIPYKQCDSTDIIGYEKFFSNFKNLENYKCLNKSGLNLTIFGSNGDINGGYSKIQTYISRCTNQSAFNPNTNKESCMSESQIKTILSDVPLHVYMAYPDVNIDFKNTEKPFFSYLRTEDFVYPLEALYRFSYYLKRTYISSDFGMVFEDFANLDAIQYDRTESNILIGSTFTIKEAYGVLSIVLSGKADVHSRSYNKLQSLVANIGGVVNFIYLVSKFIVNLVSNKSLLLKYVNNPIPGKHQVIINSNNSNISNLSNIKLINCSSHIMIQPIKQTDVNPSEKVLDEAVGIKQKKLKLALRDLICPLIYLSRYDKVYRKIDEYVRNKLSLDYFLNESSEFERVKAFLFDSNELFVLENLNRYKCKVFNSKDINAFNEEKFKQCYLQVQNSVNFLNAIG
jgi:hypothetical protein